MVRITKTIEWDMGHRVPNHKSKCRNLHGHRYRMELTLAGELNSMAGDSSEGMVFDFGDIKQFMTANIHDVLDHGFMIYEHDEILTRFFDSVKEQEFRMLRVPFVPTAENIAQWCYEQLAGCFPAGIAIVSVRIYETPNSWAEYVANGRP